MKKLTRTDLVERQKIIRGEHYSINNANEIALYLCDHIRRGGGMPHNTLVTLQNLEFLSSLLDTLTYRVYSNDAYRLYYICKSYEIDIEEFLEPIGY